MRLLEKETYTGRKETYFRGKRIENGGKHKPTRTCRGKEHKKGRGLCEEAKKNLFEKNRDPKKKQSQNIIFKKNRDSGSPASLSRTCVRIFVFCVAASLRRETSAREKASARARVSEGEGEGEGEGENESEGERGRERERKKQKAREIETEGESVCYELLQNWFPGRRSAEEGVMVAMVGFRVQGLWG